MESWRARHERRLAVSASEAQRAEMFDVGVTSRCRGLPSGPFALRMFVPAYCLHSRLRSPPTYALWPSLSRLASPVASP
jgi:hypothetical protein